MTFLALEKLIKKIEERKNAEVEHSYTASLLVHAPDEPLRKLSEEVTELLIDVLKGDVKGATKEAADVLYHYLVVLAASDISFSEVLHELEKREGMSGYEEKRSRKQST